MSEDKGKRRGTRPAEPNVPEEATLPAGALDDTLSAAPVPVYAGELGTLPMAGDEEAIAAAAAPVMTELQGVSDPNSMLTGLLGTTSPLGQFAEAMPTFGNVLLSIGTGVAASQEAMDRSVVDTIKKLQETKITVVTDVIQELGDDGLPLPNVEPTLVKEQVSLVTHLAPTQHKWKRISLSMDMSVAGMSAQHGMVLKQQQTHASGYAGSSYWGFHGWFDGYASHNRSEQTTVSQSEQQWSSGQVRLDAVLGSQRMEKLPVGVDVETGPSITFTQGMVKAEALANGVSRRFIDVTVDIRNQDGTPSTSSDLAISNDLFSYGLPNGSGLVNGKLVVRVYRDHPTGLEPASAASTLTVKMKKFVRTYQVIL
jgi:hypothetical protein